MNTTFGNRLFSAYSNFFYAGIKGIYIPHKTVEELLLPYKNTVLSVNELGKSAEGRSIYKVQAGKGKTRLLFWSQMHGDESTATRALFDIFNFLTDSGKEFEAERKTILDKLDLCFVPMLNPDGAERWQRETAIGIDINRDALRNVTVEGQLLQQLAATFKPEYGFNLHDQNSYYTAGVGGQSATISLLAPPVDNDNTVTANRKKAIQVVCLFNKLLQPHIPNGVGKWKDEYEPRAYGEFFQRNGIATILIESGGYPKDPARDLARKLNFMLLLSAMHAIAVNEVENEDTTAYNQIPLNTSGGLFDCIYKECSIIADGKRYLCDVGIRFSAKLNDKKRIELLPVIEEVGDLSVFKAYRTIDCKGKQVVNRNNMPVTPGNPADLEIVE